MSTTKQASEASQTDCERLGELLILHPQLRDAYNNDATVHSYFKCLQQGLCTLEEAYIGIIIHLVREKQAYFNEVIDLKVKLESRS